MKKMFSFPCKHKFIIFISIQFVFIFLWTILQIYLYHPQDISYNATQLLMSGSSQEVSGNYYDLSLSDYTGIDSPSFTLKKGVYHFTVAYSATSTAKNGIYYVHPRDQKKYVYEGSLNPSSTVQTIRIYVPDTCSVYFHARLTGDSADSDYVRIDSVALDTSHLTLVRSVLDFLFFFVIIDALYLICILYKKSPSVSRKVCIISLTSLFLLLCAPLYHSGLVPGVDLSFHLMRIEGIYEGLLSKQFPVKVQPGWLNGYGYAVSVFYGDTLLYIPAAFRFLGYSIEECFKIYLGIVNILTILISYHCFKKLSQNDIAALAGTVLYCCNPYRLGSLYGAPQIGSATAMIFYPLIILGLYLLFQCDIQHPSYQFAWLYLLIGYTGIIQSHIISCFLFALVSIVWAFLSFKRLAIGSTWLTLGRASLGTLLLNAWFLIPFISYYFHAPVLNVTATVDYSEIDFLSFFSKYQREGWTIEGLLSRQDLGYAYAIVILGGLVLWPLISSSFLRANRIFPFFIIFTLFLSSCYVNYGKIAQHFRPAAIFFKTLQYAERFLGLAIIFLACFVCLILSNISNRIISYAVATLLCFCTVSQGLYLFDHTESTISYIDIVDFTENTTGNGEYIPSGTDINNLPVTLDFPADTIIITNWQRNYLTVNVSLQNKSNTEQTLAVPLLYYQNYHAIDTYTNQELAVFSGKNNAVSVSIPSQFQGEIAVYYQQPLSWIIGEIISLVAFVALIAYYFFKKSSTHSKADQI